jgi:flavin reductase (DIM6/NTAB) family NADH-FMN oxidoreductase RutF
MIVQPGTLEPRAFHQLLIGSVVPRPIAFVSSIGANGRFNVAPFSYYNLISTTPPLVGIAVGHRRGAPKDTAKKVRESGEFVVNVVDEALLAKAVQASGEWPEDVDEFELTGLTPVASEKVRAPRVGESPVSFECTLDRIVEFEHTDLLVGTIVCVHVRDDLWVGGRIDPHALRAVGRLGGDGYALTREIVEMSRPRVPRPGEAAAG